MTPREAQRIAHILFHALSIDQMRRVKAIHVVPRLHDAMLTIRVFMVNKSGEDNEPYVFNREEL